jgi:epoxyqueuosine reductase
MMDDGPELLPLAAGDGGYFERAMPTFSRRAGLDAIRGNAIVALGNARDPVAVETLAETIRLEDPRLRAYSAWALGRIGGARAAALLDQATAAETDPVVAAEIDRASVRHP